jgi:hypothetical protein
MALNTAIANSTKNMPEKKNDPDATGVTGPVPNAAWLGLIARGSPWG